MNSSAQVIQPHGIFDRMNGSKLRSEVESLLEAGAKYILVDFQNTTFMDSSGLGSLVLALKAVRSAKGEFYICALNDQMNMLFNLTSMNGVFKVFSNQEEFHQAQATK